MTASYKTAVARMYALGYELAQTPSCKFDLAHMRVLLGALENPQRRFPSVLIAGTNGKGSTAATLAAILQASGLSTGLYTSPHLIRINERIRIAGEQIADDRFALLHEMVEQTSERLVEDGELPWHPSFFEMLTAIAFEYFATSRVEIAVLEVGMGGRLDATNVVDPRVSVITDISLDHQKFLGDTVTEIAREKVGIIRRGGIVVTLPQSPAANDVIGNAILDFGATGVSAVPYVPPVSPGASSYVDHSAVADPAASERPFTAEGAEKDAERGLPASRYPLQVMGEQILVETPLAGRHQLRNVALAIAAAEELGKQGFGITPQSIARGIRQTRWPGRFQVIPGEKGKPEFVFDVAHNPAGAWALRSALSSYYEDWRIVFVFGAMRDKAIAEICEILFPLGECVIATPADNPRSATAEEIRQAAVRTQSEIELASNVESAIERARTRLLPAKNARPTRWGVVVITGSIYIVGEAMRVLGAGVDAK